MEYQHKNGKAVSAVLVCILLGFSFFIMPPVLAAVPGDAKIQSVDGNQVDLGAEVVQTADINAVSQKTAVKAALTALEEQGFDLQQLKRQPVEVRYVAESVPAGDPVWAVVFRSDEKGYAYALGEEVGEETRAKLEALGTVESCTDGDGTPGLRVYYSYTRYTLVEINAFSGAYVRHGDAVTAYGKRLNIAEAHWAPSSEEAWAQELEKQRALQDEMEQ